MGCGEALFFLMAFLHDGRPDYCCDENISLFFSANDISEGSNTTTIPVNFHPFEQILSKLFLLALQYYLS